MSDENWGFDRSQDQYSDTETGPSGEQGIVDSTAEVVSETAQKPAYAGPADTERTQTIHRTSGQYESYQAGDSYSNSEYAHADTGSATGNGTSSTAKRGPGIRPASSCRVHERPKQSVKTPKNSRSSDRQKPSGKPQTFRSAFAGRFSFKAGAAITPAAGCSASPEPPSERPRSMRAARAGPPRRAGKGSTGRRPPRRPRES